MTMEPKWHNTKHLLKTAKLKCILLIHIVHGRETTSRNTNGLIRDYFPKGTDFNLVLKTTQRVKIKSMKATTNLGMNHL
jgi:hypothetical protein